MKRPVDKSNQVSHLHGDPFHCNMAHRAFSNNRHKYSDGLFEATQMDGRDITSLKTSRFMRKYLKHCSRCGT
jgi:hypothetical protein